MVQMAEELGAFLTVETSGCPSVKGVVTGPENLEGKAQSHLPDEPTAKLFQNKQDKAFGS